MKPLQHRAIQQFQALQPLGKSDTRLERIIPAAYRGQIEILFVMADRQCWGQVDPISGTLKHINETHPQDINLLVNLLELAAIQTFRHGGTVYRLPVEDMPISAPIAAIYRTSIPYTVPLEEPRSPQHYPV